MRMLKRTKRLSTAALLVLALLAAPLSGFARDVEFKNTGEIEVFVSPGEPTQLQLPGVISGGYMKKSAGLTLDKKETDLIIFANETVSDTGVSLIVRLTDGRSYAVRVKRSTDDHLRDALVRIVDDRSSLLATDEDEPPYKEKNFEYAPPSQVSGLMREMMLVSEFGKKSVAGYQMSDHYKGQTVLSDGAISATIDRIFIGPNLWGYVVDAQNLLDQTQKLNPAAFRIDGTRAVSAADWELSPRPMNAEQQIAGRDSTKVYIVTRAKRQ